MESDLKDLKGELSQHSSDDVLSACLDQEIRKSLCRPSSPESSQLRKQRSQRTCSCSKLMKRQKRLNSSRIELESLQETSGLRQTPSNRIAARLGRCQGKE